MRSRVFIIGGGPSLCGEKLNWLAKEDTIAVNHTIQHLSFPPTYFLTADSGVIRKSASSNFWGTTGQTKSVVVINPAEHPNWNRVKDYIPSFDEHIVPTRWDGIISLTKGEFATGKNSGFCALQYAVRLGYREIYLLGFDLKKEGQRKYFYGQGDGPDSPFNTFYCNFVAGLKILQKAGVNVYSCSNVSRLNAHIPFAKLSTLVPRMPVFVSHYTVHTPYEEIVLKLVETLKRWKLDYDLEGIKSLGTWRANSNYCAWQVQKALQKFDPRPVLRLDADAQVQQFPELFVSEKFNSKADVAGCFFDKSRLVSSGEFLGGTIYFGNTERSKALVDAWVELCTNRPKHRNGDLLFELIQHEPADDDDALLQNIRGLVFVKLPLTYCKIFDFKTMGDEPPVIEHFQASRRNKRKINMMGVPKDGT
jgi:hypothetical protein